MNWTVVIFNSVMLCLSVVVLLVLVVLRFPAASSPATTTLVAETPSPGGLLRSINDDVSTPLSDLPATSPASEATAAPAPISEPTPTTPPEATAETSLPAEPEFVEHTIQRGDVLGSLAEQYGVSVADILAVNTIENPDSLTLGAVLKIPSQPR